MRIATLSHRELEAGYFSVELSQLKGHGFFFLHAIRQTGHVVLTSHFYQHWVCVLVSITLAAFTSYECFLVSNLN